MARGVSRPRHPRAHVRRRPHRGAEALPDLPPRRGRPRRAEPGGCGAGGLRRAAELASGPAGAGPRATVAGEGAPRDVPAVAPMSALSRHVVVIADSRFPIREPFAGGMQSLTWHLVKGLRARGVDVTVFAGPGTDPDLGAHLLDVRPLDLSDAARRDVSMQPEEWLAQHHAYLDLMLALGRRHDVDVVHHNILHHLPR